MKTRTRTVISVVALLMLFISAFHCCAFDYPPAPKHPVTNTYFSTSIVDDYQWLENFDDPAVKSWTAAQNKITRAYLDKLPAREKVAEQLKKLYSATSANYSDLQYRPGVFFALKFKPPAQQPWLITLKSPDDLQSERVVLDPNRLNPKGTTAMDFFVPSHDGKKVAVSLSENGSEDGTVCIYDVETGKALPDQIPHVNFPTAGGSVAWNEDNSGVYYTRYVTRTRSNRPLKTSISINRFISTNSERPSNRTATNSAKTSRASPKSVWKPAAMESICWPPWPTATAAITPIISSAPTVIGFSSRTSATR